MNLSIVIIDGLKSEISAYLAAAEDVSTKIHPIQGRIQESEIGGCWPHPYIMGVVVGVVGHALPHQVQRCLLH